MCTGELMTAPQDAIATYLQTGGFGTLATNLFIDFMPATPFDVTVVSGYSGPAPVRIIGQRSPAYDIPKVQILVRRESPSAALAAIEAIYDYLEGVSSLAIGGLNIIFIRAVQSRGLYLGKDLNNLTTYTLNFEVLCT
jgi:hypothetical protein